MSSRPGCELGSAKDVGRAGAAVVDAVSSLTMATTFRPGRAEGGEMGLVITAAAKERIEGLFTTGEQQGARTRRSRRRPRPPIADG